MTSNHHDDQIEVLSVQPTRDQEELRYFVLDSPAVEDNVCVLPKEKEPKTAKEKRLARVVMVVATLMIVSSFLLVGITLSMSDHIDEMVRKMNGYTTSTALPSPAPHSPTTPPSTVTLSEEMSSMSSNNGSR